MSKTTAVATVFPIAYMYAIVIFALSLSLSLTIVDQGHPSNILATLLHCSCSNYHSPYILRLCSLSHLFINELHKNCVQMRAHEDEHRGLNANEKVTFSSIEIVSVY
jgi:hypothetical protein